MMLEKKFYFSHILDGAPQDACLLISRDVYPSSTKKATGNFLLILKIFPGINATRITLFSSSGKIKQFFPRVDKSFPITNTVLEITGYEKKNIHPGRAFFCGTWHHTRQCHGIKGSGQRGRPYFFSIQSEP
jgi:hypothetical protein